MSRFRDYAEFSAWFAALGYVVLWPLLTLDPGHAGAGYSVLCRIGTAALYDAACETAQHSALPPALHVVGMLATAYVLARVLVAALRIAARRHRPGNPVKPTTLIPLVLRRAPPRRLARVKPRTHFGLRGKPPQR